MRNGLAQGLTALMCLALAWGCNRQQAIPLPDLTEAEGVVFVDDVPLPFAMIQFVPELEHFGAEYNSMAITDANGRFKLECHKEGQTGAVVGVHAVVVMEWAPDNLRGPDLASQEKLADYYDRLNNRPIPEIYGSVLQTPLRVEVKAGQKTYAIKLIRDGLS